MYALDITQYLPGKRKLRAMDDEDEVDNDAIPTDEEYESSERRERRRMKKKKKQTSREDIERVRKTHAASGTPAIDPKRKNINLDAAVQKEK
jgi:hypothetical protein